MEKSFEIVLMEMLLTQPSADPPIHLANAGGFGPVPRVCMAVPR